MLGSDAYGKQRLRSALVFGVVHDAAVLGASAKRQRNHRPLGSRDRYPCAVVCPSNQPAKSAAPSKSNSASPKSSNWERDNR